MNWLTRLPAFLPYLVTAGVLLALAILGGLALWLRRHRVSDPPAPPAGDEEPAEPGGLVASPSSYLSPSTVAAALPFELSVSFLRAIRHLRSQTSGRQRLYRVPWFLLLGESGAGKTTLLRSVGAADAGLGDVPESRPGLGWRFFDHGVVLDVPGDYLARPDTLASHERSWRGLLRLLNRHRPRRPLDGVVLVLPAHDFSVASALDDAALARKAVRIGEKLGQLQRDTGVCFPVYVVVSKCDQIAGFQSFCQVLPPERRREIFGWSSPYRTETAFESAWVDEAFEQVAEALNRSQSELFVERLEALDPAALYFFPGELLQLRDRMRSFLHQVFRATAYRESFHCRGIYFCGDAPSPEGSLAMVPSPEGGGLDRSPAGLLGLRLPGGRALPRPVFLDDLFERKIFPEWGLAYLEARALWLRRGAWLAVQNLTLAAAVFLAVGLGWGYYHLHRLQSQTLPVLSHIQVDMMDSRAHAFGSAELQRHAGDFVRSVAALGDDHFFSAFVPASWFSSLDRRVAGAIEIAFEKSVLQVALDGLSQRARDIGVTPPAAPLAPPRDDATAADAAMAADAAGSADGNSGDAPLPPPDTLVLQQLPEYAALAQFTARVAALEDNIARYQRIIVPGHPGEVADLNGLMQYLDVSNTAGYAVAGGEESYLAQALDSATSAPFPPDVLAAARQRVRVEMTRRVDDLLEAWYQDSPHLAALQDLSQRINALRNASSLGYDQLKGLQAALDQAESLVHSPQAAWMANSGAIFDGPLRQVTLDPIQRSANQDYGLFYPPSELEAYIRDNANADWQDLHDQLASQQTALTGPLLQFSGNGVRLSPGVEDLRLPIVDLMSLSFMSGNPEGVLRADAPAGNHLLWDPAPLQQAVQMVAVYNRYLNEGLLEAPTSVRDAFRKIAVAHLSAHLVDLIGQAETWAPDGPNVDVATDTAAEIKSMQAAQPLLTELLGDFSQLGQNATRAQLLGLAHAHAYSLLRRLDAQLDADAPYSPQAALSAWDGVRPPSLAAFGLQTPEDLSGYLAFERQKMQTMAAAAAPLVNFLRQSSADVRSASEIELIARWQAIVAEVQKYDNKVPGNSLGALEYYVASDMDRTTPATHCQPAPPANSGATPPDYFLDTRARLRRSVYARCLGLDQDAARRGYTALANLFNRTLAGKFPFAAPGPAGAVEADPDAIAAFYRLLDQAQPNLDPSRIAPPAAAFLKQMEDLRPLWASLLANSAQSPVPVFDVLPTFRVNRARERGGNQIIAWTLRVGDLVLQSGQPASAVRWSLGTPVVLTLQWAKDAPLVPLPPPLVNGAAPLDPAVRGLEVSFTYTDPWSLFSLIERHRAPAVDFEYLVDPAPNTLAFDIPTGPAPAPPAPASIRAPRPPDVSPSGTSLATVFVRIAFMSPGKVESLRVPEFPRQAPGWEVSARAASDSH